MANRICAVTQLYNKFVITKEIVVSNSYRVSLRLFSDVKESIMADWNVCVCVYVSVLMSHGASTAKGHYRQNVV